ncbi:hypothetical protein A2U01_0065565, partial [Trifolium medium]|nr:hypothetical protein [Trifolium medium]
ARVLVYRSTWEGSSRAVDPSRIVCSLTRAGLSASCYEQERWFVTPK